MNSIFIVNFYVDYFYGIGKYFSDVSKSENWDAPLSCSILKNPHDVLISRHEVICYDVEISLWLIFGSILSQEQKLCENMFYKISQEKCRLKTVDLG